LSEEVQYSQFGIQIPHFYSNRCISIFWFQAPAWFSRFSTVHITEVQAWKLWLLLCTTPILRKKWPIALWESGKLASKVYKLILFIRGTEGGKCEYQVNSNMF